MNWTDSPIGKRVNDYGTVVGLLDSFSFADMPLFQSQTNERKKITVEPGITRIEKLVTLIVKNWLVRTEPQYRAFCRSNPFHIRQTADKTTQAIAIHFPLHFRASWLETGTAFCSVHRNTSEKHGRQATT